MEKLYKINYAKNMQCVNTNNERKILWKVKT